MISIVSAIKPIIRVFPFVKKKTGKRTTASNINFGTLIFHCGEFNISIELGAEVTAVPKSGLILEGLHQKNFCRTSNYL